uniref:Aurein-2.1 n=2 Tax=Ranoidea TaxID=2777416 RepID=AUR21_RANAE|nr:RecName: Full=Aurein-2.1; Contains: RecName: Full=Aurein-2.1.1 [Ranoidea raniformis]P69017.1 RecName: Full=Aurein-2.1; Contains: RecName: Full=Aurein-2.1.1 [Ranoidea aurea]
GLLDIVKKVVGAFGSL